MFGTLPNKHRQQLCREYANSACIAWVWLWTCLGVAMGTYTVNKHTENLTTYLVLFYSPCRT